MKFLAMHITNQKLRFDIYCRKFTKYLHGTWSLLNILMIFWHKRKIDHFDIYSLYCYKYILATYDWFVWSGSLSLSLTHTTHTHTTLCIELLLKIHFNNKLLIILAFKWLNNFLFSFSSGRPEHGTSTFLTVFLGCIHILTDLLLVHSETWWDPEQRRWV